MMCLLLPTYCSDNTAAVARSYGARVLVKRTGNNNKSSAVSYAVEHIKSLREEYDCIAVFDADNTVHMDWYNENE